MRAYGFLSGLPDSLIRAGCPHTLNARHKLGGKMRKRIPKKGYIYLAGTADGIYKYGCSKNPDGRVKKLHCGNKYTTQKFTLIHKVFSKDMFKAECLLKWYFWGLCISCEEYFSIDAFECENPLLNIINKMNEVTHAK